MGDTSGLTVTVATEPDSAGVGAVGVYVTTTGAPDPRGNTVVVTGDPPDPTVTVVTSPDSLAMMPVGV